MLYCLIPTALLIATSLLLSGILHVRFSKLLAPVIFFTILVLYSFYIFDLLIFGRSFLLSFFAGFILVAGGYLCRNAQSRQKLCKTVYSLSFLFLILALILFLVFSWNQTVSLYDELRLWGAYPKALHATGTLQLGEHSILYSTLHSSMQSYPPGMPLLCYFFTSFSPNFPENALFYVYSFFGFSMLFPLLDGVNIKSRRARTTLFLFIIFFPYFFSCCISDYAYYYSSLFIDIPLGICLGYSLSLAFRRLGDSPLDIVIFSISCGCIALLKDTGSFFALCSILGAVFYSLYHRRKSHFVKYLPELLLPIAVLLFTWGSWNYLRNLHAVSNHLHLSYELPSLGVLFHIAYTFLSTPTLGILLPVGSISMSLPFVLLTVFTVKYLLCRHGKQEYIKLEFADIGVQILCYAMFFIGYYFIFPEEIQEKNYPSYARYMSTPMISAIYVLAVDCTFRHGGLFSEIIQRTKEIWAESEIIKSLCCRICRILKIVGILALIMAFCLIQFNRQRLTDAFYDNAQETAQAVAECIPPSLGGAIPDVYLCTPGDFTTTGLYRHRIYFELIDENIRIRNFYDENNILSDQFPYSQESFLEFLIESEYDYVLLTWSDPVLQEKYSSLFPDEGSNLVYQVDSKHHQLIRIR